MLRAGTHLRPRPKLAVKLVGRDTCRCFIGGRGSTCYVAIFARSIDSAPYRDSCHRLTNISYISDRHDTSHLILVHRKHRKFFAVLNRNGPRLTRSATWMVAIGGAPFEWISSKQGVGKISGRENLKKGDFEFGARPIILNSWTSH